MTARDQLQCLLDKGYITQAQFNAAVNLATITNDLGVAFAISSVGTPSTMVTLAAIDETTPKSFAAAPATTQKVVLTAHGNDVLFTVTGDPPASGVGHVLKQGINYTFTVAEFNAGKFLALNSDSNASITATFYK
jgi:hypothetical protein